MGKNLIGSFYQPRFVLTDISVLSTLPEEEYICGLGEIVKYGIMRDEKLFSLLEENLDAVFQKDNNLLYKIVKTCSQIKATIVSKDERESGIRAILNFGHTFGHALETHYGYLGLKHGQAVILGMKCAVAVSERLNIIESDASTRIKTLINKFEIKLPGKANSFNLKELVSIMKNDKKVREGKINLILVKDISDVVHLPIEDESLLEEGFSVLDIRM